MGSIFIGWFDNPAHAAFAAFAISSISLLVAIVAMVKSRRTQNRLLEIEEIRERDRQKEMRKANLTAELVEENKRILLRISNKGPADACEIKVRLNNEPLFKSPLLMYGQSECSQLGPSSNFDYILMLIPGTCIQHKVTITWSDDSGKPGSYKTTLTK